MAEAARTLTPPADVGDFDAQVASEATALATQAARLEIASSQQATAASQILTEIVSRRRRVEDWFKPLVDAAHKAHKALTEKRGAILARFSEPENILKRKLADFRAIEERQRRDAERAAAEAARAEAERQQLARAEAAMDSGDLERCERILESPAPPVLVPAVEAPAPTKLDGVSFTEVWYAEVTDLAQLVRAVADGTAPITAVMADTKVLGQLARALKGALNLPGVRVWSEKSVRARGAA